MLKTFARRLSRRLGNVLKFLSSEELDDSILDKEKNLYKRGIIREGRTFALFDNEVSTGTELAEAITKIGYLAFAGGPPATKCAGEYLPKLAELLEGKDLRSDLKIAVLKVLSIITINHLDHQNQCGSLGVLRSVSEIIINSSESVLLWAIYSMHNIIVGNIPNMQNLVENTSSHTTLMNAALLDWTGFSCNYAAVIIKLLGIERKTIPVETTSGKSGIQVENENISIDNDIMDAAHKLNGLS